jgi:hypothetical protein
MGYNPSLCESNILLLYASFVCFVHVVNFAFMLCGNVGFGFVFSLQVNNHFHLPFKVYSCTI